MQKLLTISETAIILNVSLNTLRNWDKQNLFKPIRTFGQHRRYTQKQISDFVQGNYTLSPKDNQDANGHPLE